MLRGEVFTVFDQGIIWHKIYCVLDTCQSKMSREVSLYFGPRLEDQAKHFLYKNAISIVNRHRSWIMENLEVM